jgi:hypothetical protein
VTGHSRCSWRLAVPAVVLAGVAGVGDTCRCPSLKLFGAHMSGHSARLSLCAGRRSALRSRARPVPHRYLHPRQRSWKARHPRWHRKAGGGTVAGAEESPS